MSQDAAKRTPPDYEVVNRYALDRVRTRGDVYGWGPIEHDGGPHALLLIAQDADPSSFPRVLSGIHLILKPVPPPQKG